MPRRKRLEEDAMMAGRSLYEVLGVERDATHEEIRKAYLKLALQLHPDKNPGDENAKEKFQSLQSVVGILGNPEKRKIYDQTGCIEDAELSSETVQTLYEYFRTLYKKVTEKDIEEFAASYRGTEEEERDLKELYVACKGDMNRVFDQLMCSIPKQDSHRFMDIIDNSISAGELKKYTPYKKWATDVSKQPRPKPLKPSSRKNKSSAEPDADLMAIISERGKQRMDSLTSSLLARYASNGKTGILDSFDEPSEEEFQAARQRVLAKDKQRVK
eukprot:c12465_g1_i1 orf=311-1126(-)